MKVTGTDDPAPSFASSVLDAGRLGKDAPDLKSWGRCALSFLESSKPTAFS